MKKFVDFANAAIIAVTIILFVVASIAKGFTHELLLEVGVLLVSIKLIMMNYKNSKANEELLKQLEGMKELLDQIKDKP